MFFLKQFLFRAWAWARFFWRADTKYQVHSPFVFQLVQEVVEDDRNYYIFGGVAALRAKLLSNHTAIEVTDFGAGPGGSNSGSTAPLQRRTTIAAVTARSASDPVQGAMLFKLAQWLQPQQVLELGTSIGLGTAYLASGTTTKAKVVSLEGCPALAGIARANLEALGVPNVHVVSGAFEQTLAKTIANMERLDLVYFDGNHQEQPTLAYFAQCLPKAHAGSVFVFDDVHWSHGMESAWKQVQDHEKVTLTVDFGGFACAFFNPDHKAKQHFSVVPAAWKPWKFY
jgi:predicted O-methyltransferase YrrM